MTQRVKNCAMCSGALEASQLSEVSGEDGPLRIVVRNLPVLACAKQHRAPVHRDFMIWLIQQIRERETQIAAGKEQGLLFKKYECGACGKELAAKSEGRQSHPFDLAYVDQPAFSLEIDMPLFRCMGCGKAQMRCAKDLHSHVPAAIVGINDSAGFPHSG